MKRYSEFISEKALLESTLYVSKELHAGLEKADNAIATDILSMLGKDIKPDATFLDLSDKEGELTFVTMRNAIKKLKDIYHGDPEFVEEIENPKVGDQGGERAFWARSASRVITVQNPEFWKSSRNPIKMGRLARQIFPGKYSDAEIEAFVNQMKAATDKSSEEMKLVSGEEIEKWYWHDNYLNMDGDLGRSCMAKKKGFFSIYTQNPDKCRLAVLLEGGKLKGRALVWKVEENKNGIEYYMDRQYTILQSDVEKFRSMAAENGWARKAVNSCHSFSVMWNKEQVNAKLEVKIKDIDYGQFPYMDSFKRFDPVSGTLFNDDDRDGHEGQYLLHDTGGGYDEIEEGRWSDWHGRNIPSDEAVWSEPYGDYILDSCAVYIEGRGYYHEDDDSLVYCEWNDMTMHEDDCQWSQDKREYVSKDSAVRGVYGIDEEGNIKISWYDERDDDLAEIDRSMRWFEILSSKNSDWTSGRTQVTRIRTSIAEQWNTVDAIEIEGTHFPSRFKTYVYSLSGISDKPRLPEEYMKQILESGIKMSIKDCKMLGFQYTTKEEATDSIWIIDDFEYHKRLSEAGPEGKKLLGEMIDLLVNDLIPNTERIADEGEEDLKQMYEDRLNKIWGMMPDGYEG